MIKNKVQVARKAEATKRKEKLDKWARGRNKAKSNVSEYKT